MASTLGLLLQLLLVSLASASNYMGGTTTVIYRGKSSDGTFMLDFRYRSTFDTCMYGYQWSCYFGQCGYVSSQQRSILDSSNNAPPLESFWCETETVQRQHVPSDKPFQLWAESCCWSSTRNLVSSWSLITAVNLGIRSDTGEPNRLPEIAIVPFLRVPYNCPRTYKLVIFDPDGDKVECRYGSQPECSTCNRPSGFYLDQDSCTLQYNTGTYDRRVYAFQMMVDDFPRSAITLAYSDGSIGLKDPESKRRKRQIQQGWPTTTQSTTTTQATTQTTTATTTFLYWKSTMTTGPTTTQTTPLINPSFIPAITSYYTAPIHPAVPMSKLPLQFSVLVDEYVPSCTAGHYLPKYLYPTPENGAHIQAEVNKEVEIRVKAQASFSVIQNVTFSGPQGITKRKVSNNEFSIKWIPKQDNLGQHYVICFVVESRTGSRNFHSDMRCVIVDVKQRTVETNVTCSQSNMRVEVDKSTLPRLLSEDHLRLLDPVCNLTSNGTHIIADFPLHGCGTEIEEDDDFLKFKNEITTFDNRSDVITRKHLLQVQFYCQYPKRGNVTQNYLVHRNITLVWEKGMGKFTYKFEFFPNATFQTMFDPNSYPLKFDLGSRIYMQIKATSSVNNTELFVESCRAAPYDNPNSRPVYPIIENGCFMDSTVQIHSPAHTTQFRFSLEAFKFLGLHDQVYISCSVLMCRAGEPNTRCAQGCISSPQPTQVAFGRRKRAVVTQSSLHHISQGPLCMLKRKMALSSETIMSLNVVFIAGCLLAAIGMISGAALYISKISKMKYQPLPTQEN